MWPTLLEIALLILYLPVTMLFLMFGFLSEEPVFTVAQWVEFQFCGNVGPILGLLTWPCLFAAIWLRRKGKTKAAAWLRVAPLLALVFLFLLVCLLRWLFG